MAPLISTAETEQMLKDTGGVKVRHATSVDAFKEVVETWGHKEQVQAEEMGPNGLTLTEPLTVLIATGSLPSIAIDERVDVFDDDGCTSTEYKVVGALPDEADGGMQRWKIGEV